jgi:Carboxypeptidase regulatory-like domain
VTTAQDTRGVFFAGGLGSDSNGHYEINVPPGTYTVHANDYRDTKQSNSASTYYPGCYQGCTPGTVTNADVSGIDIVMQFYLHISGTVTGPDGKPGANIQVHAVSTNSNVSINVSANGTFSLRVGPGSYEVRLLDSSSKEFGCYASGGIGNFAPQGSCIPVVVSKADVGGIDIDMSAAAVATPTPAPTASPTASENTTSGTNVAVSPVVSGGSATGIALTFAQVSAPGTTSVAVSNAGPPVAGDFVSLASSPTYYDVSTTATHTGSITLCLPYDPTAYPDPRLVRLLHWNGASWDDVTSSVDSATATVCGTTTSLSPFVVAQRAASSAANSKTSPTSEGLFVGLIVAVVLVAAVLVAAWWLTRRRRKDQARG